MPDCYCLPDGLQDNSNLFIVDTCAIKEITQDTISLNCGEDLIVLTSMHQKEMINQNKLFAKIPASLWSATKEGSDKVLFTNEVNFGEISISDIKDDFKDLRDVLTEIKNEVGDYSLIQNGISSLELIFEDKFVSYKYINSKISRLDSVNNSAFEWGVPTEVEQYTDDEIQFKENNILITSNELLNKKYKIVDLNGGIVLSGITTSQNLITGLNAGVYFLIIEDKYFKFVKL